MIFVHMKRFFKKSETKNSHWLCPCFSELDIPLKTDNWNTLMKKLKYDYWEDFAEEIRSISQDN